MIFYTHERTFGCRVREYVYRGVRTVQIENELLRAGILAGKGADLFELIWKPKDLDFLWHSPWGVRNPAEYVPTTHTAASAFLDFYEGGWQDCFPTGGNPSEYQGMPFGAHGELPTLPFEVALLEDSPERVAVRFRVRTVRTPFLVEKDVSIERGSPVLRFAERITNEGRVELPVMWGQHPALGAPFIEPGCRIDLAGARIVCTGLSPVTRFAEGSAPWPNAPAKAGGTIDLSLVPGIEADTADTLKLTDLAAGWYAVRNPRLAVGIAMSWPLAVFPALWFWQAFGGAYGPPWYGRTYLIALEPFSTVRPTIAEAIADGSARTVRPGETLAASYLAAGFEGSAEVTGVDPVGRISRCKEDEHGICEDRAPAPVAEALRRHRT